MKAAEITNKIAKDFNLFFGLDAEIIEIKYNLIDSNKLSYASVFCENKWYWCKLTTKGVKKNSWRNAI